MASLACVYDYTYTLYLTLKTLQVKRKSRSDTGVVSTGQACVSMVVLSRFIIIVYIIKDCGLSVRSCPTPSSPKSSRAFCPSLLGLAPGVTPCSIRLCCPAIPYEVFPSCLHSLILLLLCILQMYPNSLSFLPISFCMIFSFSFIRLFLNSSVLKFL